MAQNEKFVPIMLTLIIGVGLQVLFALHDAKDTPHRAVVEFAENYFKVDSDMADRLCDEIKEMNDGDTVGQYIHQKKMEAKNRGLGMFYLRDSLYHVRTYRLGGDEKEVEMRLTADVKPPLKAFFTHEGYRHIDEVIKVVNDNGTWKVCGPVFSLGKS